MNQGYPAQRRQTSPEDAIGILILALFAVVAFLWFIAVSRLHMKNPQCLEIVLYITIGGFGALLALTHFIGRRRKREDNWP